MSTTDTISAAPTDDEVGGPPAGATIGHLAETPVATLSDDTSWAAPRPRAGRRLLALVSLLAALIVGLSSFAFGTKVGRDRAASSGGAGGGFSGFGRSGFPGGFGGAGAGAAAGGGGAVANPANGGATAVVADTTPADPLGGLLAGAPPADATADTTPTTPPAQGGSSPIIGTVDHVDGDTVVITTENGPVTVRIGSATRVQRSAAASAADLAPGTRVSIVAAAPIDPADTVPAAPSAETITIEPDGGATPLPSSVPPATTSP